MCGITLCFSGTTTTTSKQVDVFEQLLYVTAVRGWHGTGVFTRDGWAKDSALPREFTEESELYHSLSLKYTATPAKKGNFLVGHCRQATRGEINAVNCHPFVHNHIMMVHNGTLRNQALLPDHNLFEVDSDNIAYSLATKGTEETIKNLNGAFALVWYNTNEKTLHLIKNSERPFYLQKTTSGVWYGASEEAMLKWVLGRQHVAFTASKGFELENGVEYIFDVDGKWNMQREHEEYKAPTYSYNSYTSSKGGVSSTEKKPQTPALKTTTVPEKIGSSTGTSVSTIPADPSAARINENLTKAGLSLKLRDEIEFMLTNTSVGARHVMFEGYDLHNYETIRMYVGEPNTEIDMNYVYTGQIMSAYFEKQSLNDTEGDLVILIDAKTYKKGRAVTLQDEELYDAFCAGDVSSILDELEEEDEDYGEDEFLVDSVWEKCSWCGGSIMESEKAASQQRSAAPERPWCLDCIDVFDISEEEYVAINKVKQALDIPF